MRDSNRVKKKIFSGAPAYGGWCLSGSPVSAEIMAKAGFDWVCIDEEHSPISTETMQQAFTAIECHGSEPFVRVSGCEEIICKKVLDSGATGIIIPMIKTYEDALKAVEYTKYAPIGSRSYSLSRATDYGISANEYFKNANEIIFLSIMIEHIDALPNLDKILSVKEVDSILIGPYDLSGSMGIPGQLDNHEYKKVLNEINGKIKKYNKNLGIHIANPNKDTLKEHVLAGYTFIACGIDTLFIKNSCETLLSQNTK